jgi:type I restriction enzyme, S subunit
MELTATKYKQTEVGLIPEDWNVKSLGDIGEVKMCKRIFNYQTKDNGDIPFYKIGTFGKEPDAFISRELYNEFRNKYSFPTVGSVLISAAGTIGRLVVFDGTDSYFQDSNIIWIENNNQVISNEYLRHSFPNVRFQTEGGTIKRLYNNILKSGLFPCPTHEEEQKAITQVLSDTDALIQALEKKIAKKKHIKKGVMQKLLTPNEDWEVKILGELAEFYKGRGLPKSEIIQEGKYKCLHYGELFTKYKEEIRTILSKTNTLENVFFSKSNDVLMPTSDVTPNGLATASCIREDNIILGGDVLVIRFSNQIINGTFLSYYITQNRKQVMQLVSGSTVYHLYGSDMSNFVLSYPNIEEQNLIVQTLSDMDKEISHLEKTLSKYQLAKQGMMQKLLTGKIRLV